MSQQLNLITGRSYSLSFFLLVSHHCNTYKIADREISGITFQGRTYKRIGYDWIEYVAQIDDGRALSIGLTKLDCVPGTMPDIILTNMTFQ